MNYKYTSDLKYARLVANRSNLGLRIDAKCPQPRTDGQSIILPPLDPSWSRSSDEYIEWWYSLLHECFHNLHPEDFDLIREKKIDTRSFLGTILNLALDYKIETVNRGDFSGRDSLVHKARYRFAKEKIYKHFGNPMGQPDPNGLRARLEAVWVMDAICRIPWIPEYNSDNVPGLLDREGQEWYVKLMQAVGVFENYQTQKTSEDSWKVTCDIMRVLELDPEDEEYTQAPQNEQGDGDGDGEDGEEAEGEPKEAWVNFSEMVADDHDPEKMNDRSAGLHINYDKLPGDGWVPIDIEEVELGTCIDKSEEHCLSTLEQWCAGVNLSKRVRRELQSLARVRFEGGKKRGKTRARDLFKAVAQDDDKVFRKRVHKFNPKSTSAFVLTDFSGSMSGDKAMHATVATHELSRVMNSLQIPHEVWGFSTESGRKNKALKLKSRGESFHSDTFLRRSIAAFAHMCSNADGDFLHWAGARLMATKATRKILFVLSDGSPAASDKHGNRGIVEWTQRMARQLEKSGIEVYAIGIEDRNVELFYSKNEVIQNARDLEPALLKVLRERLIAGMV